MIIFGVKLNKPEGVDFAVSAFWAVVGTLIVALVLMPLFGGGLKQIVGVAASFSIAGLAATCGASFDKAGLRGLLFTGAVCAAIYGLVTSLF